MSYTLTTTSVRDNSTLANFKQWAQIISNAFSSCGWVQGSDSGQVNWGTIVSVPSANTYVYEIWKPNDGLALFYVKVEYGSNSTGTNPQFRITIGTGTDGSGTLTGFVMTTWSQGLIPNNSGGASTAYTCHISGDTGRIGILMWRDGTPMFFGIARSKNSSGTDTSTHVTLLGLGNDGGSQTQPGTQQTIVFAQGVNPVTVGINNSPNSVWCAIQYPRMLNAVGSENFAGNISISPVFPDVGYFDNPLDIVAIGAKGDFTEGATYVIPAAQMPYGVSHTYIATKSGTVNYILNNGAAWCALLMRYD
jgi:hypothetical protein